VVRARVGMSIVEKIVIIWLVLIVLLIWLGRGWFQLDHLGPALRAMARRAAQQDEARRIAANIAKLPELSQRRTSWGNL
jgi:hypothetical protein